MANCRPFALPDICRNVFNQAQKWASKGPFVKSDFSRSYLRILMIMLSYMLNASESWLSVIRIKLKLYFSPGSCKIFCTFCK
jgi:hypothetical protein